jgi:hypothetical protein
MNRKRVPPEKVQRVTGCAMSLISLINTPATPFKVTIASRWPADGGDVQETATGGTGASPPGLGLGNSNGEDGLGLETPVVGPGVADAEEAPGRAADGELLQPVKISSAETANAQCLRINETTPDASFRYGTGR